MSTPEPHNGTTKQRHASPPQSRQSSAETTKDVELTPTILHEIYHIIRDLVLFFCRRIIFGPPIFKLLVSFTIIIIGSVLKALDLAPNSYLSLKTNIFNIYFAKLGWAWTMGLLIPFIYLTYITTYNHYQIITRHLVRLLVATGVWYMVTSLFVHVESYTGMCKHETMQGVTRRICLSGGFEWQEGHDFSGHVFLLLYAILIINEEVKSYDKGTKNADEANQIAQKSGETLSNINHEHLKIFSKIIRINYVLLAALTILWEFMILSTALYFHHTVHKLIAAGVAVFFWYITYYVWYRSDSSSFLYPSSPKD
ncbi:unnamed protein product [Rotaria sp. Silwood1]|nr:unnamed protein product [Rotaria sp. Silwood1]CAF0860850.1 unnamed protein product [Rotaria sp. Silwood1]CAF3364745.1 unnamed protein product [Rotaria sp. Silwood1]CAF3379521.1 unnamed protein product [Rotaria sp. Silwood1]CAF3380092.1 unnamed protein product [Rotaria sp. Silwood1]